jgi:hypothetical protein
MSYNMKSADVVPFPARLRKRWINRQVNNVATYNVDAAARYLDKRIDERVAFLERCGVSNERIAADIEPVRAMFDAGLAQLFGFQRKA